MLEGFGSSDFATSLQIYEDSIVLQSVFTNTRERLEKLSAGASTSKAPVAPPPAAPATPQKPGDSDAESETEDEDDDDGALA